MTEWLSIVIFVAILVYAIMLWTWSGRDDTPWSKKDWILIVGVPCMSIVVYFLFHYFSNGAIFRAAMSPMMTWFVAFAVFFLLYVRFGTMKVQPRRGLIDDWGLKTMNVLFYFMIAGAVFYFLAIAVALLQFQRNNVGTFAQILTFIPCLLRDFAEWIVGETTSLPKVVIVLGLFELCFLLGASKMMNLRAMMRETDNRLTGNGDKDRQGLVQIVSSPVYLSTEQVFSPPLNPPKESTAPAVFAFEFWLFVNSQQTEMTTQALRIFSYSTFEQGNKDRTNPNLRPLLDATVLVKNGESSKLSLRSKMFDTPTKATIDLPLQKWLHLVIQTTGTRCDVFLNGELAGSFSSRGLPAYGQPPQIFLGQEHFNGMISHLNLLQNDNFTQEEIIKRFNEQILKKYPRAGET